MTDPVAVLALQGDFQAHREKLRELDIESFEARRPEDLDRAGKRHREIDVAARDMKFESVRHQRDAVGPHAADTHARHETQYQQRDRIAGQLATAHATIASRDAEVAALTVEQEAVDAKINGPGCEYRTTAHAPSYYDYSTGFRCCADPR